MLVQYKPSIAQHVSSNYPITCVVVAARGGFVQFPFIFRVSPQLALPPPPL